MIASVGFSIVGSGRFSTRMSPGAWRTTPRMVCPFAGASVVAEDLLGDADRRERLRPAGVERRVGDRFDELGLGEPVVFRVLQVEAELLGVPAGDQCSDGDQTAVA